MYNLPIEIQDYIYDFLYDRCRELPYSIRVIEALQKKHEDIFFFFFKLDSIWKDPDIYYEYDSIFEYYYDGMYCGTISYILSRFLYQVDNELVKYIKMHEEQNNTLDFIDEFTILKEEYCHVIDNIL